MGYGAEFKSIMFVMSQDNRERFFHLDESHDSDIVESLATRMANAGWTIGGVRIFTKWNSEYVDIKNAETLSAIFEALVSEPENAGAIISYGELFGWTSAPFTRTRNGYGYKEGYYGVYRDGAEFAKEHAEGTEEMANVPSWICIDWEESYDEIRGDFATNNYEDEMYVFTATA
jgi:hypothetical protein